MTLAAGLAVDDVQGRFGQHDSHHPILRVIMLVVFLAVVGGLIWSLIALSRAKKQAAAAGTSPATTAAGTTTESALQILDERLARGEIEPADYEARKRLLL
jgi:uncharacterized membrane protein